MPAPKRPGAQTSCSDRLVMVLVNSRFLERPQKRSCGNQLNHRRLTKTKSLGSGQDKLVTNVNAADRAFEGHTLCHEILSLALLYSCENRSRYAVNPGTQLLLAEKSSYRQNNI